MNKHFLIRWIPSILIMVSIFIFSSIPGTTMPSFGLIDLLVKKGGHMLGFGLLTLSFLYGMRKHAFKSPRLAILFALLYALTDEWHQTYVLGRFGSLWDVGIDGIGSMAAIWLSNRFDLFSKFKL